jgi:hypothetical protein
MATPFFPLRVFLLIFAGRQASMPGQVGWSRRGMKRLRNPRTGILQGDAVVFSDFEDGGEMWTGTGPRERRCRVQFSESFASPPAVQVSVSMWDMDTSAAIRAELVAEDITHDGFDIVFRTWADSRAARLRAAWMAIGDLPFADDWDVD